MQDERDEQVTEPEKLPSGRSRNNYNAKIKNRSRDFHGTASYTVSTK